MKRLGKVVAGALAASAQMLAELSERHGDDSLEDLAESLRSAVADATRVRAATLSAYLPAADAVGVFAVLDEHARHARSAGDERSMDARRGDALVDLLLNPTGYGRRKHTSAPGDHAEKLGRDHRGNSGSTTDGSGSDSDDFQASTVTGGCIPFTALLGADDLPGDLAGYGPIPAAVARDLAAHGTWRRILTDPASGRPVDYGTTRYRPPAHLAAAARFG